MAEPTNTAERLTTFLTRRQDEIAVAWAELAQQLPESHYGTLSANEVRALTRRGMQAIFRTLATGSNTPLEDHAAEIVLYCLPLGFGLNEVLQGLLLAREAALPFLLQDSAQDSTQTAESVLRLDACVRYLLGRVGEFYAQAQQRELASSYQRAALILDATQAASASPELDRVLNDVALRLAAAVGLRECRVYLLDRKHGILIPRGGTPPEASAPPFEPWPVALDPAQEPLLQELTERQQPVASMEVESDPRLRPETARALRARSLLAVPLTIGNRFLGAAMIRAAEDFHAFSAQEIELAKGMAAAVALAIENAELYAETRVQLAESEGLRRVSSALLQKRALEEILEIVCAEAQLLTGARGSAVFIMQGDGTLRPAFTTGSSTPATDRICQEQSFTGIALSKGEPVLSNSPAPEGVLYHGQEATTALLTAPLRVHGVSIGALEIVNKPGGFQQADIHLMSLFADQAAIAIDHARLTRQAEELAVLQERQRLARELHDSVTQSIYSIKLYAEAATKLLRTGNATVAAEHLGEVREIAEEALNDMRLLVFELRPRLLEKEGLTAAIQARLDAVERRTGVRTEFQVTGERGLPLAVTEELYHIAQEALNNILKHAQAQRVQVHLQLEERTALLDVYDDGVGFVPIEGKGKGRPGLRGMYERAERIGGELTIESAPGKGTRVRVIAPI